MTIVMKENMYPNILTEKECTRIWIRKLIKQKLVAVLLKTMAMHTNTNTLMNITMSMNISTHTVKAVAVAATTISMMKARLAAVAKLTTMHMTMVMNIA